MTRHTALLLILLAPAAAGALELGGTFEQTLNAYYDEDIHERLLHVSRLRLDFEAGGGAEELSFHGNINLIRREGQLAFEAAWVLPDAAAEAWSQSWLPASLAYEAEEIHLDNAYLSWRGEHWRLRAGRQQLSWGPGYSYNPTDLFHRKDMLDPSYEKEGVLALRWDRWWGVGGQATLIFKPADEIEETGLALRLAGHGAGFDAALSVHRVRDETSLDPATLLPRIQTRGALGLELSGEVLGWGLWLEGNANFMESEPDFLRAVVGLDHTFAGGTWLVLEGLFDGRGESEAPYPTDEWANWLLSGEPVGAGWLMAGLRLEPAPLATLGLYAFASPDGSVMLNPRLDLSIAQNADLTIFASTGLGEKEGAFPPELFALTGRLTVFF